MKAIVRAYNYIYQLMSKPVAIQDCDAKQLLQILSEYENSEYIIKKLKEQVVCQLQRQNLIKQ